MRPKFTVDFEYISQRLIVWDRWGTTYVVKSTRIRAWVILQEEPRERGIVEILIGL